MGIEFEPNLGLQNLQGKRKATGGRKLAQQNFDMLDAVKQLTGSKGGSSSVKIGSVPDDITKVPVDEGALSALPPRSLNSVRPSGKPPAADGSDDPRPAVPVTDEENEAKWDKIKKRIEADAAKRKEAQKKLDAVKASNGMTYKEARTIINQMREKYTDKNTGKFDKNAMTGEEAENYRRACNAIKEIETNNSALVEDAKEPKMEDMFKFVKE